MLVPEGEETTLSSEQEQEVDSQALTAAVHDMQDGDVLRVGTVSRVRIQTPVKISASEWFWMIFSGNVAGVAHKGAATAWL